MPRIIQIHLYIILFIAVFAKRLPDNLVPEEYKLEIITNLGNEDHSFDFKGSVLIHIKCILPTDRITLHSKKLVVDDGKTALRNLNQTKESLTILQISQDVENDFLILTLSQTLQADLHYEVEVHFHSNLEEEKVGYFRSTYLGEDQQKKWLAVTYFKPDNARRAFPCFDEVALKAKFTISLGRSGKYRSLSNMQLMKTEEIEGKPGWELDHFQTTPPMSTYNVGFMVIDFKHSSHKFHDVTTIELSFWGREIAPQSPGDIVTRFSAQILGIVERAFEMNYPLSKMDIVAIPHYPVPVRESWGLIVWQEEFLIQATSALFGVDSMVPVANQMVRQLFENLVTIKSWSDVWFTEGFCMFVVNLAFGDYMAPKNELFMFDVTVNIISVFNSDSFRNARAVSNVSHHFDSSGTSADINLYRKASLLLRMLSNFMGQNFMRDVVRKYLKIYAYKSAGSAELLALANSLPQFQSIDIKAVMDGWFSQPGYPLITVTRDYEHGRVLVYQERFFKDSELLGKDPTKWWIPLTYTTECEMRFSNRKVRKWLSPNQQFVSIKGPLSPLDWMIFNIDVSGLYMVNYDEANWRLLVDFLNRPFFEKIPPLERAFLVENAASLASIGRLDYSIYLDLLRYVPQELELQVKYVAVRHIDDLSTLLKRKPIYGKFMRYARKILGPYSDKSVANEIPVSRQMEQRSSVSDILASVVFLKKIILCVGDASKEYAWSMYRRAKASPDFQSAILRSLTCSENQTLLQNYLEKSLDEKSSRNEDIVPIITALAGNKHAFHLVTGFLAQNIETIHARISPNVHQLSSVIMEIARHIVNEDEETWLKRFVDTNREYFQEVQSKVVDALEIAKLNVRWHNSHYHTVETYLEYYYDD